LVSSRGASKLFSAFIKEHQDESVVTYADRRYSYGDVYLKLGFKLLHISKPGYFYHSSKKGIVSRYQAQKHKLKDLLGEGYDETQSETQNMINNGFEQIFDCGQLVFGYNSKIPKQIKIPPIKKRLKLTIGEFLNHVPENLFLYMEENESEDTLLLRRKPRKFKCSCGHIFEATPPVQ
jgi:hypothetical protein